MLSSSGRVELLFEIVLEPDKHVAIGGVVARSLVVDLPTDHVGIVLVMGDDVPDQPLGIKAVCRRIRVHVLADAVGARHRLAAERSRRNAIGQDLRMLVSHPRRERIGRRAENHLDPRLAHGVNDVVHPGIFELAVFRLPQAPRGFAHAHHVQARGLHQLDVLLQPRILVAGHVLVVVGRAVQHGGEIDLRAVSFDWAAKASGPKANHSHPKQSRKSFT